MVAGFKNIKKSPKVRRAYGVIFLGQRIFTKKDLVSL
jgi:hypothetical protein